MLGFGEWPDQRAVLSGLELSPAWRQLSDADTALVLAQRGKERVNPVKTLKATLLLGLFCTMGCSVFGVRTAEELSYSVLNTDESIEIREYAPHIAAQASVEGTQESVQRDLFRALAGYIFGKNTTQEEISMTAPVVMDPADVPKSETIEMTAPVTMTSPTQNRWTMAFSMPSKYSMQTLPKPVDDRVTLVEVPARTVVAVRYTGSFNDREKRTDSVAKLTQWLTKNPDYKAVGKPFFAGYDPPFTLPFLRRNEVLLEIKK